MGKIRGTHSSPGVFDKITDLSYAANTMGITTAALVGETIKGPAFQPIKVTKWSEFVEYFGGTNPKKFKDSQYPKYELPYIAKSYLKASDQLYVCRVLGLSGYNAGPAFLITASGATTGTYVVAVLRSRGKYVKSSMSNNCGNGSVKAEGLDFDCDEITLEPYNYSSIYNTCDTPDTGSTEGDFSINSLNLGRFTIVAKKSNATVGRYPVSLNAGEKDYIYNVIGGIANEGNAAVFVEELYDVMLADAVMSGKVSAISSAVTTVNPIQFKKIEKRGSEVKVNDYVTVRDTELTKKDEGSILLYWEEYFKELNGTGSTPTTGVTENLGILQVVLKDGKYTYEPVLGDDNHELELKLTTGDTQTYNALYVKNLNSYVYASQTLGTTKVDVVRDDMCDYREMFRYASTPWIVSQLMGDRNNIEIKKLFRFHTITDGNYANQHIKISIANIRPDDGTFDVQIRDFNDVDASPVILESYHNLTMVPGDPRYIGLKIGTFDGAYEVRSKFVTVEVIENEMTQQCVPAGFLGYPVRAYQNGIKSPYFKYNTEYYNEIKDKRQYFGVSDITGIDVDILNYKGKDAYVGKSGYTNAFHLDAELNREVSGRTITIDGEKSTIVWDAVDLTNTIEGSSKQPLFGSEETMEDTIYENVKVRKFTVCPYGGFDGWDIYRGARTNTDAFKASQYKGAIDMPSGKSIFTRIGDAEGLALTGNCITSDYYAYLAGVNQFINPETIEINLLATPGIDYVNNKLLLDDVIDVVEGRFDTFYVPTTPDKPWGASDDPSEMFTSTEAAANLEDSSIDTYYAATYYPWAKFFDTENNIYINLPATKDVLRNMAEVDDKRFPWYAPAGMERGKVDCKDLHTSSTIEDRDNAYDGRINPLIKYSKDGVRVWGNKTMYICEETNPMNRINAVRCLLYMRKLINESSRDLIFDPNDDTLADEYRRTIEPILKQIKKDRGITDYKLNISQTPEQMDLHEISCTIFVKPTPTLEYIEINYVVTPQGIKFEDIKL